MYLLLAAAIVCQTPSESATLRALDTIRQRVEGQQSSVNEQPWMSSGCKPGTSCAVSGSPPQSPPVSESVFPDRTGMIEEMLAFIYIHHGSEQMERSQQMFNKQTDSQVRIIYRTFLETKALRQTAVQQQQTYVMGQAQLNLDRAKAYRDHLARELQMRVAQQQQEANLVHQHQHNLAAAMQFGFGNFPFPGGYGRAPIIYPRRYGW